MKFVSILSLLVLFAGQSTVPSLGQMAGNAQDESKYPRFPGSRTTMQGEVWLAWDTPIKAWFVEAALSGYKVGYDEGCKDATQKSDPEIVKQQKTDELCSNGRRFRNKTLSYSQQMSEFYRKYPGDRDIPLAYLLQMLIGPKPKTLDEIHRWVAKTSGPR
jgi:hypothetical protein